MRHAGKIGSLLASLTIATAALAQEAPSVEEERPVYVTYGADAAIRQGDNDHRQAIYFSVPADTAGKLYIRVFDPDTNNSTSLFDQIDRRSSVTRTRFTVFGGEGAFISQPSDPEKLTDAELTGGTKLAERTFARERRYDAKWETLAGLDAAQGELVEGKRIFRLVVEGLSGVNGNIYDLAMSTNGETNVAPAGLRMFAYTTTVRMPRRGVVTELRFRVPEDAYFLTLGNFDAAFGTAFYTTEVKWTELTASGQGEMERSTVSVAERDRGKLAAATLSGGEEYPNDATFFVMDFAGGLIPFELPPRVFDLNQPPTAVAASDTMGTCMSVRFDGTRSSDPEGAPLSYLWRFGDGEEAASPRATHAYRKEGRFTAMLEVIDHSPQLGNGDTIGVPVFVKNPPEARSEKRLLVGAGEETVYDGRPSTARQWQIARHQWDFGDGTEAEGDRVAHAFATPGTYQVTHRVTDDSGHPCNEASEAFSVRVNAPPMAEAGRDRHIAIGEETVFDASASSDPDGTLAEYRWDFGDGDAATGAVVRHSFEAAGTYEIKLAVTDDSAVANSGAEDRLTVIVNDPPLAEAGADLSGAITEPLTFNGGGSRDADGEIILYEWDFGDGTLASGAEVSHAYEQSGTYEVRLKVTDDSTTRSADAEDTLSVRVNQPPVAEAGPHQVVTASVVSFDGSGSSDSDDKVAGYEWDFGDGSKGDGASPQHVYVRAGSYDVKLTVTDASGTIRSSASDTTHVVVNALPIADAGPDLLGAPGKALVFQGGRSVDPDGDIAEYHWDFRDGATASGRTVKHAFAEPGSYAVRLTVRDDTGHDAAVDHAETLVVINQAPIADAGADIAVAPDSEVRLSGAGSFDHDGSIASYRWDFSDSDEPLDGREVTRLFDKPGIYTAQLTVTDNSGTSNGVATDSVRIAVNHAPAVNAGADIVTDQSTIMFDGTGSVDADGDGLTYRWDFGDGATGTGPVVSHTYAQGGTYPVLLTVDDGSGLANASDDTAISVAINRPPVAVAGKNRQVCTGDTILFDGSRSTDPEGGVLRYSWEFGDGTTANLVNPTKSYSRGGTYPVTLRVQDDSGFASGTGSARVAVIVDQGPVAHAGEDITACAGTEVAFDGSASTDIDGVVNSFAWDFGGGGFGGGEKPRHVFEEPGLYRVLLKIEGEQAGICDPSSTDEIEARIIEGPVAVIKAPAAIPLGEVATFDGAPSTMGDGKIVAWRWDFGDGETADGVIADHKYTEAGTYQVSLTLESDSASPSCRTVAARHLIRINAPPVADAGQDRKAAVNQAVIFDAAASHDPDGGITVYEWDFGDGSTASGMEVRHRYSEPGSYTATLTVRDEAGLANSTAVDRIAVDVSPAAQPEIAGPEVACIGEEVRLQAASRETNPGASYEWSFGDGASARGAEAAHIYKAAGTFSLALRADDGKDLVNSRQAMTRMIHINRPPFADAGPDKIACPGAAVSFDGGASRDADGEIVEYQWDFGDGTRAEGQKAQHVFAKPGTYRVTLTAKDSSGSTCATTSDTADTFINAPPVADAGGDREVWIGGAHDALLLDGTASQDPDGQALSHSWRIGETGSEYGEQVRHVLTEAGTYPVELTVTDTSGLACGSASTTVHITARPR